MKKYLIFYIALLFINCESSIGDKSAATTKDSTVKQYLRASDLIYGKNLCRNTDIPTEPVVRLNQDTLFLSDSIRGSLFFSTNDLRKIATCNQLDYKISFDIIKPDRHMIYAIEESAGDTIHFTLPYDSLKIIDSSSKGVSYLLKGTLRASYFKLNEVLGYDTMMTFTKQVFVKNEAYGTTKGDYIIFGKYCGQCMGGCATMYKLDILTNTLYVDRTDSFWEYKFGNKQALKFSGKDTDSLKNILAKRLNNNLPSFVLSGKPSERIGCPDCTDGCGIYIEIKRNNIVKKRYIDYQTSQLSGEIKKNVEYIKSIIDKM